MKNKKSDLDGQVTTTQHRKPYHIAYLERLQSFIILCNIVVMLDFNTLFPTLPPVFIS
jgi:hypothetical protein